VKIGAVTLIFFFRLNESRRLTFICSNTGARAFYATLGFAEYARVGEEGSDEATLFLAAPVAPLPSVGGNPYPGRQTNVARYVEGAGAALAMGDECLGPRWVAVTMPEVRIMQWRRNASHSRPLYKSILRSPSLLCCETCRVGNACSFLHSPFSLL
jgi:hypothetical protein